MAISTNQKPTIYRNLHENTGPGQLINDTGPVYLQELVNMYRPGSSLRSQSDRLLTRPRTRSRAGDATFVAAAADLWNTLPLNLRLIEDTAV